MHRSRAWKACRANDVPACTFLIDSGAESQRATAIAYVYRGDGYRQRQQYSEALIDYSAAIKTFPDMMSAYNNRAMVHAIRHDYAKALGDLNQAIVMQPNSSDLFCNRGILRYIQHDITSGKKDLAHALELEPHSKCVFTFQHWFGLSR